MKMNKDTELFRVLTGSRLYGTATESSDYDYKAVCLPSLADVLLNKKLVNKKERPEGVSDSDKMLEGGTETKYLPLQVFFDDFYAGQTYALELAFAVSQGLHEVPGVNGQRDNSFKYQQKLMQELLEKFLTGNVKKMVGYAVSQSKLYGLKTQRFETLTRLVTKVENHFKQLPGDEEDWALAMRLTKLEDTPLLLERLTKLDYVKMTTVMNARGGQEESPGLEVNEKKFPLTTPGLLF